MKKRTRLLAAGHEDRISALPEEIIHEILALLRSPKQAAQVTALSKRWTHIWHSYPILEFDDSVTSAEKFAAAIRRRRKFAGEQQQQQGCFRIWVKIHHPNQSCYALIADLFNLAADEGSPLEIEIAVVPPSYPIERYKFPLSENLFRCLRVLKLRSVDFLRGGVNVDSEKLGLILGASLRTLCLTHVGFFDDGWILNGMIAGASLLETLTLNCIRGIRRIQVRNHPNLKSLEARKLWFDLKLVKVEIVALATKSLESVVLHDFDPVRDIELVANRLRVLDIGGPLLTSVALQTVLSKIGSLKSLTVRCMHLDETHVKLSIPKLEEFNLQLTQRWEEIELDAGPSLAKFVLCFREYAHFPDKLAKCVINNAADCRWEVVFHPLLTSSFSGANMAGLKIFMSRFTQFQKVNIQCGNREYEVKSNMDDEDLTTQWMAIKHLKFETEVLFSRRDLGAILTRLTRICQPKFLTIIYKGTRSDMFSKILLSILSHDLHYRLKDMKIAKRDIDEIVEEEKGGGGGGGGEFMDVFENAAVELETRKRLCFMLTWY